jgi:hypothetical protein
MIDAKRMQLHGFAIRTQEAYLSAVRQLAKHYRKSPDQINEEELRQHFLFLKNEKHAARNICTLALYRMKFFFERTLGRDWKIFEFLHPPKEKKLPVVLSRAEAGAGTSPTLPGLPDHDLYLRSAPVGRGASAGERYRWGTPIAAYLSGERWQRSLCSPALCLPDCP